MPRSLDLPSASSARLGEELASERWAHVLAVLQVNGGSPNGEQWASLLDVAFFASLAKEEGRSSTFSLSVAPPIPGRGHMLKPLVELSVTVLQKLSAACHADATALQVWHAGDKWMIWGVATNPGATRPSIGAQFVDPFLVLSARDPGSLRLHWAQQLVFSFTDGKGAFPSSDEWVRTSIEALLPLPAPDALGIGHVSTIYRAMRAHERGGTLLVVPNDAVPGLESGYTVVSNRTDGSPASHLYPLALASTQEDAMRRMAATKSHDADAARAFDQLHRHLVEQVEAEASLIGRLTGMDGAVVIDHAMRLKTFAGKIPVPPGFDQQEIEHIATDRSKRTATVGEVFKGMRHKSAAAGCMAAGPGSFALVQSQDGALSVIACVANSRLWVIKPLERLLPFWR